MFGMHGSVMVLQETGQQGTNGLAVRQSAGGEKREKEKAPAEEEVITREDVAALAEAVNIITADSVVAPAQEDLEELQEDRAEFIEVRCVSSSALPSLPLCRSCNVSAPGVGAIPYPFVACPCCRRMRTSSRRRPRVAWAAGSRR
jgi:hypothetical protein